MGSLKIGIVTPTLNSADFLSETIESIWREAEFAGVEMDHIVVDGGSSDNTEEIVASFPSRFVHSPDDAGMYDAISKGFAQVGGTVLTYLNSDDVLAPGSLRSVVKSFRDPKVRWIMGRRRYIDRFGSPIVDFQPIRFSVSSLAGLGWSAIPQETVWFRRELYDLAGPIDRTLRSAADYDLFLRFRKETKPLILREHLASFRLHDEQLSSNASLSRLEAKRVADRFLKGKDKQGCARGNLLRVRLNARNWKWFLAKKRGAISLGY